MKSLRNWLWNETSWLKDLFLNDGYSVNERVKQDKGVLWNTGQYTKTTQEIHLQKKKLFNVEVKTDFYKVISVN